MPQQMKQRKSKGRFLQPATDDFGGGALQRCEDRQGRTDNTGREGVMGNHGPRAEMNENGERWADFCQANELVIGGTLFPH